MDTAAELEPGSNGEHGADASASPVRGMSLWPPPRSNRHSGRRRRKVVITAAVLAFLLLLGAGGYALWKFVLDGAAAPSGDDDAPVSAFEGSWSGQMKQVDTNGAPVAEWDAQVRIEEGAERGSTAWTTFSCSGTLELSARDGDRLVYIYSETSDPQERCVDDSELTVWPNGDGGLDSEWASVTDDGTRMVSTGVLE
ncbi:hypothetical protein GCM10007147_09460 [Nocardiopsis kunsanensis]|uniref:Uncharacterized protein n=1 Tax=Nocardiopsis kunsanensis TaxID=141693 RepID=A0A919CFP9_9ACTN|nr:hypothetical protein [Nocardiopsis kunsanensis]GHD18854.1 hypothetical protein GCM10007147_09460 [Nocardiopsis kunsanensis]